MEWLSELPDWAWVWIFVDLGLRPFISMPIYAENKDTQSRARWLLALWFCGPTFITAVFLPVLMLAGVSITWKKAELPVPRIPGFRKGPVELSAGQLSEVVEGRRYDRE